MYINMCVCVYMLVYMCVIEGFILFTQPLRKVSF